MTSHHETASWAAVRAMLLQLVREHEVPLYRHRMANVHPGLVISSCLGLPLLDALHRTARQTQLALVAPNRAAMCGGSQALGAGLTAAGSLEEILLPNG